MPGVSSRVACELHMSCAVMCHVPKNEWASYSGNARVSSIGMFHAKSTFMPISSPHPNFVLSKFISYHSFSLYILRSKFMYKNHRFALSMACLSSYII